MDCNCHGLTFAQGTVAIDNSQVDTILKGDKYEKTSSPKAGDVAVYRDANGDVVHSATVTGVDSKGNVSEVSGLGGLETQSHSDPPGPGTGSAWNDSGASVTYYHMSDDKRTSGEVEWDEMAVKDYKKE
jgi:hypothetical protein